MPHSAQSPDRPPQKGASVRSLAPPEPGDTELQVLPAAVIGPALATTGVSTPSVRRRTERRMVFMVALVIWFSDFCGGHERLLWTLNPTISSGCRILGAASGSTARSTHNLDRDLWRKTGRCSIAW